MGPRPGASELLEQARAPRITSKWVPLNTMGTWSWVGPQVKSQWALERAGGPVKEPMGLFGDHGPNGLNGAPDLDYICPAFSFIVHEIGTL